MSGLGFKWDPRKPERNFQKHGVRFSTEAITVFSDDYAITVSEDESDASERRFVSLGMGGLGRFDRGRITLGAARTSSIISARPADLARTQRIRGTIMKDRYDFGAGKRGRIVPPEPEQAGKVPDHHPVGSGHSGPLRGACGCIRRQGWIQTLMNDALRSSIEAPKLRGTGAPCHSRGTGPKRRGLNWLSRPVEKEMAPPGRSHLCSSAWLEVEAQADLNDSGVIGS